MASDSSFCQHRASHSSIPRRAPLCSCCNCVSSNPSKWKTTHARQRCSDLHQITEKKKKASGKVQEVQCLWARERAAAALRLSQHLRPDWTLNVSPMSALMQTRFQARRPSKATPLPSQQLRITGHSILIAGCHWRPNRLMNTVLQYY